MVAHSFVSFQLFEDRFPIFLIIFVLYFNHKILISPLREKLLRQTILYSKLYYYNILLPLTFSSLKNGLNISYAHKHNNHRSSNHQQKFLK